MQPTIDTMHDPAKGAEEQYFAALAAGKFRIQWCAACRQALFYPRQFCPDCLGDELAWIAPSGKGTVYATTTVRLKPDEPYNVCIVELDEGVRLMSRVESVQPDAVRIGMRVRARVVSGEKDSSLVVFEPLEG
jgi:uncharacterized protein